jgi:hypothetical protein
LPLPLYHTRTLLPNRRCRWNDRLSRRQNTSRIQRIADSNFLHAIRALEGCSTVIKNRDSNQELLPTARVVVFHCTLGYTRGEQASLRGSLSRQQTDGARPSGHANTCHPGDFLTWRTTTVRYAVHAERVRR